MQGELLILPVFQTMNFFLCCNIIIVEQRIHALAKSWLKKASKSNDCILNFTYHHQSDNKTKTSLNIIKGNRFSQFIYLFMILQLHILQFGRAVSFTIIQTQILRWHYLLLPVILSEKKRVLLIFQCCSSFRITILALQNQITS